MITIIVNSKQNNYELTIIVNLEKRLGDLRTRAAIGHAGREKTGKYSTIQDG